MVYHKRYMFDSGRHPDEDFKKPGSVIRSPGRRGSTADHESVDVDAQQQNQHGKNGFREISENRSKSTREEKNPSSEPDSIHLQYLNLRTNYKGLSRLSLWNKNEHHKNCRSHNKSTINLSSSDESHNESEDEQHHCSEVSDWIADDGIVLYNDTPEKVVEATVVESGLTMLNKSRKQIEKSSCQIQSNKSNTFQQEQIIHDNTDHYKDDFNHSKDDDLHSKDDDDLLKDDETHSKDYDDRLKDDQNHSKDDDHSEKADVGESSQKFLTVKNISELAAPPNSSMSLEKTEKSVIQIIPPRYQILDSPILRDLPIDKNNCDMSTFSSINTGFIIQPPSSMPVDSAENMIVQLTPNRSKPSENYAFSSVSSTVIDESGTVKRGLKTTIENLTEMRRNISLQRGKSESFGVSYLRKLLEEPINKTNLFGGVNLTPHMLLAQRKASTLTNQSHRVISRLKNDWFFQSHVVNQPIFSTTLNSKPLLSANSLEAKRPYHFNQTGLELSKSVELPRRKVGKLTALPNYTTNKGLISKHEMLMDQTKSQSLFSEPNNANKHQIKLFGHESMKTGSANKSDYTTILQKEGKFSIHTNSSLLNESILSRLLICNEPPVKTYSRINRKTPITQLASDKPCHFPTCSWSLLTNSAEIQYEHFFQVPGTLNALGEPLSISMAPEFLVTSKSIEKARHLSSLVTNPSSQAALTISPVQTGSIKHLSQEEDSSYSKTRASTESNLTVSSTSLPDQTISIKEEIYSNQPSPISVHLTIYRDDDEQSHNSMTKVQYLEKTEKKVSHKALEYVSSTTSFNQQKVKGQDYKKSVPNNFALLKAKHSFPDKKIQKKSVSSNNNESDHVNLPMNNALQSFSEIGAMVNCQLSNYTMAIGEKESRHNELSLLEYSIQSVAKKFDKTKIQEEPKALTDSPNEVSFSINASSSLEILDDFHSQKSDMEKGLEMSASKSVRSEKDICIPHISLTANENEKILSSTSEVFQVIQCSDTERPDMIKMKFSMPLLNFEDSQENQDTNKSDDALVMGQTLEQLTSNNTKNQNVTNNAKNIDGKNESSNFVTSNSPDFSRTADNQDATEMNTMSDPQIDMESQDERSTTQKENSANNSKVLFEKLPLSLHSNWIEYGSNVDHQPRFSKALKIETNLQVQPGTDCIKKILLTFQSAAHLKTKEVSNIRPPNIQASSGHEVSNTTKKGNSDCGIKMKKNIPDMSNRVSKKLGCMPSDGVLSSKTDKDGDLLKKFCLVSSDSIQSKISEISIPTNANETLEKTSNQLPSENQNVESSQDINAVKKSNLIFASSKLKNLLQIGTNNSVGYFPSEAIKIQEKKNESHRVSFHSALKAAKDKSVEELHLTCVELPSRRKEHKTKKIKPSQKLHLSEDDVQKDKNEEVNHFQFFCPKNTDERENVKNTIQEVNLKMIEEKITNENQIISLSGDEEIRKNSKSKQTEKLQDLFIEPLDTDSIHLISILDGVCQKDVDINAKELCQMIQNTGTDSEIRNIQQIQLIQDKEKPLNNFMNEKKDSSPDKILQPPNEFSQKIELTASNKNQSENSFPPSNKIGSESIMCNVDSIGQNENIKIKGMNGLNSKILTPSDDVSQNEETTISEIVMDDAEIKSVEKCGINNDESNSPNGSCCNGQIITTRNEKESQELSVQNEDTQTIVSESEDCKEGELKLPSLSNIQNTEIQITTMNGIDFHECILNTKTNEILEPTLFCVDDQSSSKQDNQVEVDVSSSFKITLTNFPVELDDTPKILPIQTDKNEKLQSKLSNDYTSANNYKTNEAKKQLEVSNISHNANVSKIQLSKEGAQNKQLETTHYNSINKESSLKLHTETSNGNYIPILDQLISRTEQSNLLPSYELENIHKIEKFSSCTETNCKKQLNTKFNSYQSDQIPIRPILIGDNFGMCDDPQSNSKDIETYRSHMDANFKNCEGMLSKLDNVEKVSSPKLDIQAEVDVSTNSHINLNGSSLLMLDKIVSTTEQCNNPLPSSAIENIDKIDQYVSFCTASLGKTATYGSRLQCNSKDKLVLIDCKNRSQIDEESYTKSNEVLKSRLVNVEKESLPSSVIENFDKIDENISSCTTSQLDKNLTKPVSKDNHIVSVDRSQWNSKDKLFSVLCKNRSYMDEDTNSENNEVFESTFGNIEKAISPKMDNCVEDDVSITSHKNSSLSLLDQLISTTDQCNSLPSSVIENIDKIVEDVPSCTDSFGKNPNTSEFISAPLDQTIIKLVSKDHTIGDADNTKCHSKNKLISIDYEYNSCVNKLENVSSADSEEYDNSGSSACQSPKNEGEQSTQDNSGQLVCFFCGFVPSNNNSLEDHIGEDHNDKFKVIILPPVKRPRKRNSELIPVLKGHSCKIIGCDFRSTHLSPSLTEHISHPDPLCRQLRSSQANLAPILSPTLAKVKKRPKPTFRCQKCRFKTHSSKTLHNHSLKKHKSSIQSKLKRDQKLKKKLSSNQDLSGVVQKTSENFQTEPKATEADDRISESVSDETSFNGHEIVNDNCDTSENPILSMQKILESSSSPNDKISETQNLSVNKIFESQNLSSSELSETSNRSETEILETLNSSDQNASNKSDSEILETSNSSDSEILETSIPSDSENLETPKPSEQKIFEIPEPFEKEILETPNLINSEILVEKTSNPQSDSEISKSPEPSEQVFLEAPNLQNSEILKTPNLLSSEIMVEKTSNPQPDSEISKAPEPSVQEILDCALLENSSVEVESLKSKSNSEADKIQPLTTMPSQDIETKNGSNKLCLRGLEKVNPLKRAASCDQISEDMVGGFMNPQTKRQKLDDQPESGAKPSENEIDGVGNNSQDHPDQNPVLDLNQPNIANVGAAIEITYQLDSVCVDEESDSNIGGNSKSSSEDENNGEISDMDGPEKLLSALDHSDDSLSSKSTSVIAKESSRAPSTLEETQEELKKKDPDQHQFEVPSNPDHGSSLSRHVGPPHQVVARCDGKRSWADYVMHEHDYPATDSGGELKALEEDLLLSSNEDVSDGFLNFFGNESDIQETANKSNGPNVDTESKDQNRDTGSSSNKNTSVLETVSITTLGPPEHVSPQPVHEVSPVPEKKVPEITIQNEREIVFEASRNGDSEPETEDIVSTTGKRRFTSEDTITLDLEVENGSSNEYLLTRSRHGSENLFDLHPQPSPRSGESYGGWSHRTLSAKSSTLSDTTWDKHRSAFTSPENMESQDLDDDCVEKKKCLPASSRKRKRCNSPPETSGEDETDEYGNGPATKRMHTPVPEIPRKRKTAKVLNKALKKIVSKNRRAEFSSFGELNFPSLELERNRCLICKTSFKFCSHLKGCRSRRRLQSSSDFGLRHQSRNLLMNNSSFQKRIVVPNPPILIPAASDYVGVDESDIERYEEVTFREGQNNLDSNATDYDISYAATNVNCLATAHFNHVDDQHCSSSTSNAAGPSRLGSRSGKRSSGLPVKMSSRRNNQKELEIENVESSAASSTEPPNVRETVESRCNGESGGEPKRVIIKFFSDEKVTTATASKGKGRSNLTVTKKRKVVINGCRVYGTTLMNDINSSPVIDSTLAKPKSKVGNLSLEWDMNVFDRVRAAEASAATTNETCDDAPAPLLANRLPWSQSHFGTTQVRIRSMYQDEDSYSPPHFKMPPRFVYSRTSNVAERQSSRSVDPPTAASTSSDIQSQQPN